MIYLNLFKILHMEKLLSQQYFKDVSSDWDEMGNSFFGDAPRKAILSHLQLRDGAVVADVGCGTGYLTEGLDLGRVKVIAIDQSPEMLDAMKAKFGADANIEYRLGQSENLPVRDETVDVVMANMYVHHVERPSVAISEMVRILKPRGVLVFTDMDKHNYEFLIAEQHDRWMGFDRPDIEAWMGEAGLTEVTIDSIGTNCCADSSCSGERAEIGVFIAHGVKPS